MIMDASNKAIYLQLWIITYVNCYPNLPHSTMDPSTNRYLQRNTSLGQQGNRRNSKVYFWTSCGFKVEPGQKQNEANLGNHHAHSESCWLNRVRFIITWHQVKWSTLTNTIPWTFSKGIECLLVVVLRGFIEPLRNISVRFWEVLFIHSVSK